MKLATVWLKKADDLGQKVATKVGLDRPYRAARSAVSLVHNRAGLVRMMVTGRVPDLASMENDWFPTKHQMLLAHETLGNDILVLRKRLDAVANRVGLESEVERMVKGRKKKGLGKIVQIDAGMAIGNDGTIA